MNHNNFTDVQFFYYSIKYAWVWCFAFGLDYINDDELQKNKKANRKNLESHVGFQQLSYTFLIKFMVEQSMFVTNCL